MRVLRALLIATLCPLASARALNFTVTNTNASGAGSLRQAIINANANSGPDVIDFRIGGSPPFTIIPDSGLPTITDPVLIDATTQPGFTGTPIVELNGVAVTAAPALTVTAGSTTIRGLVINRFVAGAIDLRIGGGNVVEANYLGTDVAGNVGLANSYGVLTEMGSTGNRIGGTASLARNVISASNTGIVLDSNSNVVLGNFIGLNAGGTAALGNGVGININTGSNNTIGGTAPGALNVISGNTNRGIQIGGPTSGNLVAGNYIGVNAAGTAAVPNLGGILILGSAGNTIGGTSAAARNIISGNTGNGVEIQSVSPGTVVQGNFIGTNPAGTAAIGNTLSGVAVLAVSQTIGGTASGAGNLISGNNIGITVSAGASSAVILGNLIGTDVTGTVDVGNSTEGVFLSGTTNAVVGGTAAGARNVISGNNNRGVQITGGSGHQVLGNYIGVNAAGTGALGNTAAGVQLSGTAGNMVGGAAPGAGNVISGNGAFGVLVTNAGSTANTVAGNLIGTDAAGTAALENGTGGVQVSLGSANTIGGSAAGARNVISGNKGIGVQIFSGATGTLVQGNFIGTDISGALPLGNGSDGASIDASNNSIGGTGAGQGNRIAFNSGTGVRVGSGTGNAIQRNSIFSNGALGIDLLPAGVTPNDTGDGDTGSNNLQNFPIVTAVSGSSGSQTVTGTLNSTASTTFTLEFFSNASCDSSGNGEGRTFVGSGSVATDGAGNVAFVISLSGNVAAGEVVTATATDPSGNTSEFSSCAAVVGISINDVSIVEGNSGTSTLTFTVSLSAASAQTVTVNFATADNTATAPSDYVASSSPPPVTFLPAQTSRPIGITINGDTTVEPDETFFVNLSNPVNAILVKPQGIGTILNDDSSCPTINLSPATLPAGTQGVAYSQTITASGGASPYSFLVVSGTLPGGMTLSGGGILSGTPGAAGTFSFTIQATDTNSCKGSRAYTLSISPSSCPAPPAPSLSADAGTVRLGQAVTLTWTGTIAAGQGSYTVQVSINGGAFFSIATVAASGASAETFSYAASTVAGSYDFRVLAVPTCGPSSSSTSNVVRVIVTAPCPNAPVVTGVTLDSPTAVSGGTFTLRWNAAAGPLGTYGVFRSTDGGKTFQLLTTTGATSFTGTTTDPPGTTVTFEVEVQGCLYSPKSNFATLAVVSSVCDPPGPVSNVQIRPLGGDLSRGPAPTEFFVVSWTAPAGGTPPTRFGLRINGEAEVSVPGTSMTLLPRGTKLDPIQAFVKAYGCVPEKAGPETAGDPVALFLTPPKAQFSVSSNPRVNAPVVFTDTSSPQATSWLWIFDDATTDTRQSPNHTFAIPGPHVIFLIASNPAGSSQTSQSISVGAAGTALAVATSVVPIDSTDPGRRRARVELLGQETVLLRLSTEESRETTVFLRFLDSTGALVLERRLSVLPGAAAVQDLGAYGLGGTYTIELVSNQNFEPAVTVVGRPAVREVQR